MVCAQVYQLVYIAHALSDISFVHHAHTSFYVIRQTLHHRSGGGVGAGLGGAGAGRGEVKMDC